MADTSISVYEKTMDSGKSEIGLRAIPDKPIGNFGKILKEKPLTKLSGRKEDSLCYLTY